MFGNILIKIIVFIEGKISAFSIYWPWFGCSSVLQKLISWIDELQIVRNNCRSGHPIVIGLINRGTIVPRGIGFKVGLVLFKPYFYPPIRI